MIMTIFLFNGFNQQNKLSRVLDELGGILKKENHQNLTPDMMETFLDGSPQSKCLENAKTVMAATCVYYFPNFTKESQFKVFELFPHFSSSQYISIYSCIGQKKKSNIVFGKIQSFVTFR